MKLNFRNVTDKHKPNKQIEMFHVYSIQLPNNWEGTRRK